MTQIGNDLIEAYKGWFEDEIEREYKDYVEREREAAKGLACAVMSENQWGTDWAESKIRSHPPRMRLHVYLEWNGILGYTGRIWEISQGEL